MKLLCMLGGHEAGDEISYARGYYLGRCRRCDADMVRSGGGWEDLPEGRDIVWRAPARAHPIEAQGPRIRRREGAGKRSLGRIATSGPRIEAGSTDHASDRSHRHRPPIATAIRRTNAAAPLASTGQIASMPEQTSAATAASALQRIMGLGPLRSSDRSLPGD